jgi:hypothetical protein
MPHRLIDNHCRDFPLHDLPQLLEAVPLAITARLQYMHDVIPIHSSRAVRDVLCSNSPLLSRTSCIVQYFGVPSIATVLFECISPCIVSIVIIIDKRWIIKNLKGTSSYLIEMLSPERLRLTLKFPPEFRTKHFPNISLKVLPLNKPLRYN